MSNDLSKSSKGIKKSDVLSSAAITSLITFILLTWSKTIPHDSTLLPYVNEQTISFSAGAISFIITLALSFLRYEINLKLHERDYTKKVNCLKRLLLVTTDPETKKSIELSINELLKASAKSISEENI